MASYSYNTSVEINDEEIDIIVYYVYHRAHRGATDGRYGQKIEPDEPAYAEIDHVDGVDGKTLELTDSQYEKLENEIMEHLSDY